MVSAYNTRSSARSMGAQAVSALQLLETMQSLELTPAERLQFGDQCLREWRAMPIQWQADCGLRLGESHLYHV